MRALYLHFKDFDNVFNFAIADGTAFTRFPRFHRAFVAAAHVTYTAVQEYSVLRARVAHYAQFRSELRLVRAAAGAAALRETAAQAAITFHQIGFAVDVLAAPFTCRLFIFFHIIIIIIVNVLGLR